MKKKNQFLRKSISAIALGLCVIMSPAAGRPVNAETQETVYIDENFEGYEVGTIIESGKETAPEPVDKGQLVYSAGNRTNGGCWNYAKAQKTDENMFLDISENRYANSNRGIKIAFQPTAVMPTVDELRKAETILECSMDIRSTKQFIWNGFGKMPVTTDWRTVRAIIDPVNNLQYVLISDTDNHLISSEFSELTATGFTGADFCEEIGSGNAAEMIAQLDNIKIVEKQTDLGFVTFVVKCGEQALEDATITIDEMTLKTDAEGCVKVVLPNGTYEVETSKAGYRGVLFN